MHSVWLATIVVLLVGSAGCANVSVHHPGDDTTNTTTSTRTEGSVTTTETNGHGSSTVDKSSTIFGTFDASWTLPLEGLPATTFVVNIDLGGAANGGPPAALLTAKLIAPSGSILRSANLAPQGPTSAHWTLSAQEANATGGYKVELSQQDPPGAPAAGAASFSLHARVAW